jgi:hypothetical protein
VGDGDACGGLQMPSGRILVPFSESTSNMCALCTFYFYGLRLPRWGPIVTSLDPVSNSWKSRHFGFKKNRVNVEYHATMESCSDKFHVDIPNVV